MDMYPDENHSLVSSPRSLPRMFVRACSHLYDPTQQQPYDDHSSQGTLDDHSTTSDSRDSVKPDYNPKDNQRYTQAARRLRSCISRLMILRDALTRLIPPHNGNRSQFAAFGIPLIVSFCHFLVHLFAVSGCPKTSNTCAAIALCFLVCHRLRAMIGLLARYNQNCKDYNTPSKVIMLFWISAHTVIFMLEVILILDYWLEYLRKQHEAMLAAWIMIVIIWCLDYYCLLAAVFGKLSLPLTSTASKFVHTVGMNMWCIFAPVVYFLAWAVVLEFSELDSNYFEQRSHYTWQGFTLSTAIWFPVLISI